MTYLRLYGRLVGARMRGQMQYRLSFALLVLSGSLFALVDFLAVLVFFQHVPHVAGWTLWEIALLYALSMLAFSLAEMVGAGFDLFHTQIVQGSFDRVLTRPLGAFFQLLAWDLRLTRIGRVVQSLAIGLIAQREIGIEWTPERLAVLLLGVVGGVTIYVALFVIGAASCFWTTQSIEAVNILTNGSSFMTTFPLEAYGAWLRRFVTFVVPVAFINYFPVLYILDRDDPLGLPGWVRLASPLVALAVAAVAGLIWSAGVRRYQSTGT